MIWGYIYLLLKKHLAPHVFQKNQTPPPPCFRLLIQLVKQFHVLTSNGKMCGLVMGSKDMESMA